MGKIGAALRNATLFSPDSLLSRADFKRIRLEQGVNTGGQRLNHYSLVRILLNPSASCRGYENHFDKQSRHFAKDRPVKALAFRQ